MTLIQKQLLIMLCFISLGPTLLAAQIGGSKFERITGTSGLSLSTVRSILQDQTLALMVDYNIEMRNLK